ncbi:MAG: DUF192 domain-containing protein [bacterium]
MAKKKQHVPPAGQNAPGGKKTIVFIGIVVVLAVVVALVLFRPTQPSTTTTSTTGQTAVKPDHSFKKQGEVRFVNSKKEFITAIDVELAETSDKRQLGLMFRESLAENQGMLFVFDLEEVQSFWMKNTLLSLDIIYVNADYEIVSIHKNTVPQSEEAYESGRPALYVVEVNAGFTDRHGIKVGDSMRWSKL